MQTLEQAICGRRRRGDIPGRDIPLAYHDFVRSGDAWIQQAYLKASNTGGGDYFGNAVAISGDTVVVGANLYVLTRSGELVAYRAGAGS